MASPVMPPSRTAPPAERRAPGAAGSGSIPTPEPLVWGLSHGDRWFLAVMLIVLAGLLTLHVRRDVARQSAPVEIVRTESPEYRFLLDPNTANWVEWAQLDGIGPTLAKRIVAHRDEHGPFRTPDDVGRVKGIGPKTLDKLRPHLVFDEQP